MSTAKFPVDDTFTLGSMPAGEDFGSWKKPEPAGASGNASPKSSSDDGDGHAVVRDDSEDHIVHGSGSGGLSPGASAACSRDARKKFTVVIMLVVNLLNYMDRYTIAGVLQDIQDFYKMSDADAGLLQTAFIISYMVFSPLFGYLGDRYNRKLLMCIGVTFWSFITLASSFIPQEHPWLFTVMRGCVGIGEASYSTIAPTIIADMFVGKMRTTVLSVFYFAIPVGSGLGYIVGAYIAKAFGGWEWSLRVTPVLGVLCVLCLAIFVREPVRGEAEGTTNSHLHIRTSIGQDLKQLLKTKSFMLSTFGFTCVAFVTGALAFFAPTYMYLAYEEMGSGTAELTSEQVSLIFGVLTCISGFLGVGVGAEVAKRYKLVNPRADPLVCAFGLLSSMPFLFVALVMTQHNLIVAWVLIFIGETLLALNWAIVTDILLYVVIPTRRSTAAALQIFLSHFLGDAGSPYLVGQVSDHLRTSNNMSKFMAQQYALYLTAFVCVFGGGFFLFTALFVVEDKKRAEDIVRGFTDVDTESPRAIPDDEQQLTDEEHNDLRHSSIN